MAQSSSYPRAILHFDGDSFFASVEQMKNWRLRGKPVVTGGERGSATSLSIEAKRLGIVRSTPIHEIRRQHPEVIAIASDYTAYSIFAKRMYAIARTYTPHVEEYSIDECFADITHLAEERTTTYEAIAQDIKDTLERSLGITFGVGLASSKTLAKVASKRNKPAGLTCIPTDDIEGVLRDTEIYNVWGLGGALSTRLRALGVFSAYDFISKEGAWLTEHGFGKNVREVWLELQGHAVLPFGGVHQYQQSVMHTRTFTPPSTDRAYIFSQLSKNVEAACAKIRRINMKAHALSFYLKTQEFTYHAVQMELPIALDDPGEMLRYIEKRFDEVYATEILYRASGVTLRQLVHEAYVIPDLFGAYTEHMEEHGMLDALDAINKKFGRETIFLGSSMRALTEQHGSMRAVKHDGFLHYGPTRKKSLDIPHLGIVH